MNDKYVFDSTQNIGTVIFVVEGGRKRYGGTELRLLKAVFADLLNYQVQELRRGEDEFIAYGSNPYSKVFALNLPKNQLTQLNEDALDELYKRLKESFKVKPEDCRVFFIYDRDYKSYKRNELRNRYVKKYTDPFSDSEGNQGQLLLSYPCAESYLLSLHIDDVFKIKYGLGKELKTDASLIPYFDFENGVSESELIHSVVEMNKGLKNLEINGYDIDNLAPTLLEVYDKEQAIYAKESTFNLFSFISMVLLELEIIKPDEEEQEEPVE